MSFLPSNSLAPFLPTSQVFPEDESQRLIVLTDNFTSFSQAINQREIGIYETIEQLNGRQYFNSTNPEDKRFGYRKVFSFNAIAVGATLNIAHNITGLTQVLEWNGGVIVAGGFRPIPRVSATDVTEQIQVDIVGANIVIVNGAAAPAITSGVVVLDYLKN